MINFNGQIISDEVVLSATNRAFLYGDGVFETMKICDGKILFFEDHYFRLMSSMRILRMEIPMNFTLEYLESQILALVEETSNSESARIRFVVYRNDGGYYLPDQREIAFLVTVESLPDKAYSIDNAPYVVDIYKDYYVNAQLLSSIKSTNKIINITGSIYAFENGLANCFLLNDRKNVISALNGNFFMFIGNKLITPPVSEGCLNGVMRRQILELAKKMPEIEVVEEPISPFDLQKADEIFFTNVIKGIIPVTSYRKKEYSKGFAESLLSELNKRIEVN